MIKTYEEMNKEIKTLLRLSGNPSQLYAAQRIEELEKENDNLQYYKKRFEEESDKHLTTLAEVREELLDLVNTDNRCGDMLACTVSNPGCMSCLAKNIKGVIEQLQKDIKEWESISDKQVQHLIRNGKEIMDLTEENERYKQMYESTGAIFNRQLMKDKIERYENSMKKAIFHIDVCFSDECDADTALNYAFNELKEALKNK